MHILRLREAVLRLRQPTAAIALAAAVLSCGDRATAGPGIATPASLAVSPSFQPAVAGGPVIVLERVEGWLVPIPAADSSFAKASFAGGEAALAFDVIVIGREQRFVFRLDAYAAGNERVFASTDTIVVQAGRNALVDGVALDYVARDADVAQFVIAASTLALAVGDTVHLRAEACCGSGEQLFPVNAGWTSRDPLVAGVDRATGVVSAVAPGRAWMIGTLFNGAMDSVEVAVGGGVSSVTISSPAVTLDAIGAAAQLAAVAMDATGAPVDAPIAWRSLAPWAATVDATTGLVTAAANGAAPIVAEAAGVSDTLDVVVAQAATSIEATADLAALNAIGFTATIAATARDANGYPVSSLPIAFAPLPQLGTGQLSISAPTVSSDGSSVRAKAVATGDAWVEASAGADSSAVRLADSVRIVVRQVAATVAITPVSATLLTGDTARLSLEVRDSAGVVVPAPAVVWTSAAPAIAAVDDSGAVVAASAGRTAITAAVGSVAATATIDVLAAPALTRTWIGGDVAAPADWMNGANWSPGGTPAPGDTVVVPVTANPPALWIDATVASLAVATGASLHVERTLTVTGDASGSMTGPGTVRLAGTEAAVAGDFPSLLVESTARAAGDVRTAGPLVVSGGGRFRPSGRTIAVGGDLSVTGGGTLVMNTPGDSVSVGGSVLFSGGDSRDVLTSGVLVVRGDFQAKGIDAFHADSTLRVVLAGDKAPQLVTMDAPGSGAQHFGDVVVANATTAGVRFTGVWIVGTLRDDRSRPARAMFDSGVNVVEGGVSLVVTGGEVGGAGALTVLGDIEAPSSSVTVSQLHLGGAKGTTMIGALGVGHAMLELLGKAQPLRSGLAYRSVRVSGSAALVGPEPVTFDGSLVIEGDAAEFAPNGTPLTVAGGLSTGLRGVLALRNDADDVTVKGAVTIDGGPTDAALLYGVLRVRGDFTVACKTAECFAPSANGSFVVELDGVERQTVALMLPGAPGQGGALQHFRNVLVRNTAGVTFATGTPVLGDLTLGTAARVTIPAGVWLDVAGTLLVERSGSEPGAIENYGELYAGIDESGGAVSPNDVQPRK